MSAISSVSSSMANIQQSAAASRPQAAPPPPPPKVDSDGDHDGSTSSKAGGVDILA